MFRTPSKIVLGLSVLSVAGLYSLIVASSALAAPKKHIVQGGFEQSVLDCIESPTPRPKPTPTPIPTPIPTPVPTPTEHPTQVPEPATTAALLLGAVGMLGLRKKK